MDPLYCTKQMGRKGVISSHVTLYSRTERKGATQIAARSTAVLVDQFVKGVAEGRFTKHTRGSLRFVALSFIKKKFGTQLQIDSGTS